MRPVLLEMNGFASFREPTKVDFADADFFALVGPTGSGKSTVIDAMTFALYGSVPRWGRKGMISLGLAPTMARGTVKLVFDVEGQRYVVARELRRMGNQVNQRAASLERLTDPAGLAAPEERTEPLAGSLAEVTDKVERLLGLSYEDFCQCVVLPQGKFADFLHAKPSERQEILLRLLGAEHYKQMMMRANQCVSNAAQRAQIHTETLSNLADATPEAEQASRAAAEKLADLKGRTDAAIPQIHVAQQDVRNARTLLEELQVEHDTLATVQIPDGVAALDESLTAARQMLGQARVAEQLAEEADRTARAAVTTGPQRGPLERVRDQRAEHARESAILPQAHADLTQRSTAAAGAAAQERQAASALEDTRSQRDEAARLHEDAGRRVQGLADEHTALANVTIPADVKHLAERHRAAETAMQDALAALTDAEQADSEARASCSSAVASGPLEQALRDLNDLSRIVSDLTTASLELDRARAETTDAESQLREAEAARQQSLEELDAARRANVIADLRPHLVPGHACPVCEQTVSSLPAHLEAPAIGHAQAKLTAAEATVSAARAKVSAAASTRDARAARIDSLTEQRARGVTSLALTLDGPLATTQMTILSDVVSVLANLAPPRDVTDVVVERLARQFPEAVAEVEVAIEKRRGLDEAAEAAAAAVEAARTKTRSARSRLDEAEVGIVKAWNAFNAVRDPVVRLDAPPAGDVSIATAWSVLASWARNEAEILKAGLASAREDAEAAAVHFSMIQAQFAEGEAASATAKAQALWAARAEQEAQTRLAELTRRVEDLGQSLEGAPDEQEVTEQLKVVTALENAAAECERHLLAARSERTSAERKLSDLEQAESVARTRLLSARDPLVRLGAPTVRPEQTGLLASWTDLAAWATEETAVRDCAIANADRAVTTAQDALDHLTAQLSADLASSDIDLAPDAVAAGAPAAVAEALERARAATARIVERRIEAANLTAQRDAELDRYHVAKMVGDLLRSDRFPRWLVTAAVDVLVAEASEILAELSNGQYDLTHENGDFYIIDHTDADSRRSVRTLSGGETFQASLALALALSSQMTALAAAGAARLDSIFLDEGFGTLDPETLNVVATTLESLAQGKRMVGIVTHVTALAERVPLRFAVSRDARTSTIVREGFISSAAA
jgi:DNA repair protein SbcC/Rad50